MITLPHVKRQAIGHHRRSHLERVHPLAAGVEIIHEMHCGILIRLSIDWGTLFWSCSALQLPGGEKGRGGRRRGEERRGREREREGERSTIDTFGESL